MAMVVFGPSIKLRTRQSSLYYKIDLESSLSFSVEYKAGAFPKGGTSDGDGGPRQFEPKIIRHQRTGELPKAPKYPFIKI